MTLAAARETNPIEPNPNLRFSSANTVFGVYQPSAYYETNPIRHHPGDRGAAYSEIRTRIPPRKRRCSRNPPGLLNCRVIHVGYHPTVTGPKHPANHALIVGGPSARASAVAAMQKQGFRCAEMDDPYAAAAELLRRPLVYRALVLSLASLFREELAVVATIRNRLAKYNIDIWLTHIEGREAALADAVRMGAAGLLDERGELHRMAPAAEPAAQVVQPQPPEPDDVHETAAIDVPPIDDGGPILSADELHALLDDEPAVESESEPG